MQRSLDVFRASEATSDGILAALVVCSRDKILGDFLQYTASEVRRLAQRAKDAAQARRLLAIAAVLDGASREQAAKIGSWIVRPCGIG